MKNFRIDIQPPKSKRLTNKRVILKFSSGFDGHTTVESFDLKSEDFFFVFKVPSGFDWVHDTDVLDSSYFDVEVEYTNPDNTRMEVFRPVPYEI